MYWQQECEWNGKTEPLKVYALLGGSRSEMCNDVTQCGAVPHC